MPRPALLALCGITALLVEVDAQAAAQMGGKPPKAVVTKNCHIGSVFAKLGQITASPECRQGCVGKGCRTSPTWLPGKQDKCSAKCGAVFEPFWDQCGATLTSVKMGGMDEMSVFYQSCLQVLYPPHSCGTYCNAHTFDCYLKEVKSACCDEKHKNCVAGTPVPKTCPVGCALVFPDFLKTCRAHVKRDEKNLKIIEFEAFEQKCLKQDALALVEYAMDMKKRGCFLDLSGGGTGGRRRVQTFVQQYVGSSDSKCSWDVIDDIAKDVDNLCCGGSGKGHGICVHGPPRTCSPACAVAMHQFTRDCKKTLDVFMPAADPRRLSIGAFESLCIKKADVKLFLSAIMGAKCPAGVTGSGHAVHTVKRSADTLFFEDFEGTQPVVLGWRGKGGAKKPYSAVLGVDPDPTHKHFLRPTKCTGGGDAFSMATIKCSLAKPCVVEYDYKGELWQGFSTGYPGSHTWSATVDPKYAGSHIAMKVDTKHWQHAQYIFPVKQKSGTAHIHGSKVAVGAGAGEHFMVESYSTAKLGCNTAAVDNILISRASPQRLCDTVDHKSYVSVCKVTEEWHKSIDRTDYVALPVCNVLVNTNGGDCDGYCKSQGHVCRHAQDNVGNSCKLDAHHTRQTVKNNGCNQKWQNQVCGCQQKG